MRLLLLAVVTATGLTAACGQGPRPNDDLGVLGDNARAGQIEVLNVHIEPPADDRYAPGDDVVVRFTMVNNGQQPDELTSVTVPGAQETVLHWDAECDGAAESVDAVPLPAGSTGVDVGPPEERQHQPYYLAVRGLKNLALAGTNVPMSFTFADAGTIEVEAIVAIDRLRPTEYEYACGVEPKV